MKTQILTFITQILGTAGGIALVTWVSIKFFGKKIVEAFLIKYKTAQKIQFANTKAILDNQGYVSRKQYDLMFKMYRKISAQLCEVIDNLEYLIPKDMKNISYPIEPDTCETYMQKHFESLVESYGDAKTIIYKYLPFMREDHFQDYLNILISIEEQTDFCKEIIDNARLDRITENDCCKTKCIEDKYVQLSKKIRDYLQSLAIIAD